MSAGNDAAPQGDLPTVCWSNLPEAHRGDFSDLFNKNGGVVLHFFAVVHKIGWNILPVPTRVLMVSHSSIYQCMTTQHVNRCVLIKDVSDILYTSDNWLGIKVDKEREHDMLFKVPRRETLQAFIHVVKTISAQVCGPGYLNVRDLRDESVKPLVSLKKHPDFKVQTQPFVLKIAVWREKKRQEKARKAALAAAAEGGAAADDDDAAPPQPVDVQQLADPATLDLIQTAPFDTPRSSPSTAAASPPRTASPLAAPQDSIVSEEASPLPKVASMHRAPAPALPPPLPPQTAASSEDTAATAAPAAAAAEESSVPPRRTYAVDDRLQVRRSTGLWEDCVVFKLDEREGCYALLIPSSDEKKAVPFDKEHVYLRRLPVDADGVVLKEHDCVKLTEDITADGETLRRDERACVLSIPGAVEGSIASIEANGWIADVESHQIRLVDEGPADADHTALTEGDRVKLLLNKKVDGTTLAQFSLGDVLCIPGDDEGTVATVLFDGHDGSVDVFQNEIRIVPFDEPASPLPEVEEQNKPQAPPDAGAGAAPLLQVGDAVVVEHPDGGGPCDGLVVDAPQEAGARVSVELDDDGLIISVLPCDVVKKARPHVAGHEPPAPAPAAQEPSPPTAQRQSRKINFTGSGEEPSPPPPPPQSSTQSLGVSLTPPVLPYSPHIPAAEAEERPPVARSAAGRQRQPEHHFDASAGGRHGTEGLSLQPATHSPSPPGKPQAQAQQPESPVEEHEVASPGGASPVPAPAVTALVTTAVATSPPPPVPQPSFEDAGVGSDAADAETKTMQALMVSGDFHGLGSFVQTLCSEYRTRVAELRSELREEQATCVELRETLRRADAQRPLPPPPPPPEVSVADFARTEEALARSRMETERQQQHIEQLEAALRRRDADAPAAAAAEEEAERQRRIIEQLEETVLFLRQRVGTAEAECDRLRGAAEEKDEQVLEMKIENERKEVDTLLLKEAVVLAERRCDEAEAAGRAATAAADVAAAAAAAATASPRGGGGGIAGMSPEELYTHLTVEGPLTVTLQTASYLLSSNISGARLVSLLSENEHAPTTATHEFAENVRAVSRTDYVSLLQLAGLGSPEVPPSVPPLPDRGASFDAVAAEHYGGVSASPQREMKELTKVAWIISCRSKLVEEINKGYQMVRTTRSLVASVLHSSRRGDVSAEMMKGIAVSTDNLRRTEGILKRVVSNYFMDFEKLHLGIAGHKNERAGGGAGARGRSRSPNRGITDLESKLSVSLTLAERRVLVKLTSMLYRSSHVKARTEDGHLYHSLPPAALSSAASISHSHSPSRTRLSSVRSSSGGGGAGGSGPGGPGGDGVISAAASTAGEQQGKGFDQIMYLTPPAGSPLVALSSDAVVVSQPRTRGSSATGERRGRTRRSKAGSGAEAAVPAQATRVASPANYRTSSPSVAFGRSALPRPESPVRPRRGRRNSPVSRGLLPRNASRNASTATSSSLGPYRSSQESLEGGVGGGGAGVGGTPSRVSRPVAMPLGSKARQQPSLAEIPQVAEHREHSTSGDSHAESVPLSAWATDLKPTHHPFFPLGHT